MASGAVAAVELTGSQASIGLVQLEPISDWKVVESGALSVSVERWLQLVLQCRWAMGNCGSSGSNMPTICSNSNYMRTTAASSIIRRLNWQW